MPLRSSIVPILAGLLAAGCAHTMHVDNLGEYEVAPVAPAAPPRTVGLASANLADPDTRGLVDGVADALRREPSFDRVLYPLGDGDAHLVDVALDVSVSVAYAGSASNFLVSWPGYLVFAPAIWGYGYEAAIDTRIAMRSHDGARELRIPMHFRFRQAELDRTWIEIGWLEAGIIPLVGGIFFTRYDTDLTPEFVARVALTYGAFVARRIAEAAAAGPAGAPAASPGPEPPAARSP